MSKLKKLDALGDRMKTYERVETEKKFIPNLPVYVRLDGRSFSKFTKKMKRPYDKRLSNLMEATTKYLVKEFNATVGYTQSDEISLVFNNSYESPMIFNGKVEKIVSVLASAATAYFNSYFSEYFLTDPVSYTGRLPMFDCRAFNVPSMIEATNAVLWRYLDAMKNSKQMLAQHYFSHKELQNLNGKQLVEKLEVEKQIVWEDYPEFFKSGVFIKRQVVKRNDGVIRHKYDKLDLPTPFYQLTPAERLVLVSEGLT